MKSHKTDIFGNKICEECMAHVSKEMELQHVCPPFLKMIIAKKRNKGLVLFKVGDKVKVKGRVHLTHCYDKGTIAVVTEVMQINYYKVQSEDYSYDQIIRGEDLQLMADVKN